tara:strand:+ start:256 stop:573 length:318 start_codon:yes stop_codon:yes gene_type:complete
MTINLKSKEQKNKFIEENLSNLLDSINETYGPILAEELKVRLKYTIDEFNDEIVAAFNELKNKETSRQKMYEMIKEGTIPVDNDIEENTKVSDWENKINEIESQK